MQSRLKRFFLFCGLLLCCATCLPAFGQEPDSVYTSPALSEENAMSADEDAEAAEETAGPRVIRYNRQMPSEDRWLEATSDDAYSYRTTREYRPEATPQRVEREPGWIDWLVNFFRLFTTTTGKIILWALLIGILAFIVYRLVVGDGALFGRRDVRPEPTPADELTTEGLMDTSWEARMRAALAAGEQGPAIRYGYLHLLQQLQAKELIRFRADKTNIAYYRELEDGLRPEFRDLTRVYEYAWYGGYIPDAAGMSAFMTQLDQFLQRISQ